MSSRTVAFDEVELSPTRGCLGRLYFKIPGGLKYGQHFLNVQFQESLVRVPFRIVTKEEEKILSKNWKDIRKQVQEAFKKGGKGPKSAKRTFGPLGIFTGAPTPFAT